MGACCSKIFCLAHFSPATWPHNLTWPYDGVITVYIHASKVWQKRRPLFIIVISQSLKLVPSIVSISEDSVSLWDQLGQELLLFKLCSKYHIKLLKSFVCETIKHP